MSGFSLFPNSVPFKPYSRSANSLNSTHCLGQLPNRINCCCCWTADTSFRNSSSSACYLLSSFSLTLFLFACLLSGSSFPSLLFSSVWLETLALPPPPLWLISLLTASFHSSLSPFFLFFLLLFRSTVLSSSARIEQWRISEWVSLMDRVKLSDL